MCYVNRGVGCQLDATANNGGPKQRKDLDPTAAGPGIRVKFMESYEPNSSRQIADTRGQRYSARPRTLFLGCRLPRVLDRAATRQNSLPIRRHIFPLIGHYYLQSISEAVALRPIPPLQAIFFDLQSMRNSFCWQNASQSTACDGWIMALPSCPYCRELFTPSRYHPDQVVCSGRECQRQRRTDYHRQRLKTDPSYCEQCRDSQQQWREQHPEYMRNYRKAHRRQPAETPSQEPSRGLIRLLECVKNNLAIDLTSGRARIWLISSDDRVKNILATAELVIVEALPGDE